MDRAVIKLVLAAVTVGSCAACIFLGVGSISRGKELEQLRREAAPLGDLTAENAALQKRREQAEELKRLRRNHAELAQLTARVEGLRKAEAERKNATAADLHSLQEQNAHLAQQVEEMRAGPATFEARRTVDASQLQYIARFFAAYARNNDGRFPTDFSQLKYYLPANVYAEIETNRFEIVLNTNVNNEPARQPLVRTRSLTAQNSGLCLFGDGHLEAIGTP